MLLRRVDSPVMKSEAELTHQRAHWNSRAVFIVIILTTKFLERSAYNYLCERMVSIGGLLI